MEKYPAEYQQQISRTSARIYFVACGAWGVAYLDLANRSRGRNHRVDNATVVVIEGDLLHVYHCSALTAYAAAQYLLDNQSGVSPENPTRNN